MVGWPLPTGRCNSDSRQIYCDKMHIIYALIRIFLHSLSFSLTCLLSNSKIYLQRLAIIEKYQIVSSSSTRETIPSWNSTQTSQEAFLSNRTGSYSTRMTKTPVKTCRCLDTSICPTLRYCKASQCLLLLWLWAIYTMLTGRSIHQNDLQTYPSHLPRTGSLQPEW